MNKSKKPLAVLSTAAVAGLIAAAVTTPVSAQTTALATNGKDSKVYEYNFANLKTSAAAYVLNGATDPGAILYNHFTTNRNTMKAYYDDVKLGYVDASVVNTAAATEIAAGRAFVLNTFTEATTTPTISLTTAKVAVNDAGQITVDGVVPGQTTDLAVSSVSAITKNTITVNFNRATLATDSDSQIVVVAPNGIELVATGTVAIGSTSATYTFESELNQAGTYTVKGTTATSTFTTAVNTVLTTVNTDNSVKVTGTAQLADAVQISTDGTNFVNAALAADGSFTYTTPILSAGNQTITVKAFKGSTVVTKTTTVSIAAPAQLSVVSAQAVSPDEIKVVFNQQVTDDSAVNKANYQIFVNGSDITTNFTPTLLADKKTVVLAPTTKLVANQSYQVKTVTNLVAKANYVKMADYSGLVQLFTNTNGPVLQAAALQADNTLKLTFDKHVDNTMVVKVDGVDVGTVIPGTTAGIYTAVTPAITTQSLLTSGQHTVVVSGAKDLALSPATTAVQQMAYNVSADTTAPSVASVTQNGYNSFKVTFSEPIYNGGGTEAANLDSLVTAGNLVVKNGNFTYTQTVGSNDTDGYVSTTKATDADYTYIITLNDNVKTGTANYVYYPLYADGTSSTSLSLQLKGFKDAVGLVGNIYNNTVSMAKETVKPYVASTNLNTTTDAQSLKIKFSENLKSTAADLDATKVSVYDANNVLLPLDGTTPLAVTNDVLTVKLASAASPTAQQFKIVISSGAVKDLAGNKNDDLTTYLDNRAAATPLTLTSADPTGHAASIATGTIGVADDDKNVITVNYNVKMGDSAIVLANYKLDGSQLPVGSKVDFTDTDKKIVKITLPDNVYSVKSVGTLTLSKNIITDDGTKYVANADKTETNVPVALSDNIKPVLQSAKFVATSSDTLTKTIELKFSEKLGAFTKDTVDNMDDLVVTIGGADIAVQHMGLSIAKDGTGAADVTASGSDTIRIAVADYININQPVTVKVVPVGTKNTAMTTTDMATKADGTSVAGNTLTEATTVTVTGITN